MFAARGRTLIVNISVSRVAVREKEICKSSFTQHPGQQLSCGQIGQKIVITQNVGDSHPSTATTRCMKVIAGLYQLLRLKLYKKMCGV